jgi:hypothetical protein
MTLEQAIASVTSCVAAMNARYQKVVFDEWALVSLGEHKGRLLAYHGPRRAGFRDNFLADAGSLRTSLLAQELAPGNFEFARTNIGTSFEAFMVVGNGLYLICNNTVQSMDTIAKDPLWIGAQVPFVELSEQFTSSPVDLSGLPIAETAAML